MELSCIGTGIRWWWALYDNFSYERCQMAQTKTIKEVVSWVVENTDKWRHECRKKKRNHTCLSICTVIYFDHIPIQLECLKILWNTKSHWKVALIKTQITRHREKIQTESWSCGGREGVLSQAMHNADNQSWRGGMGKGAQKAWIHILIWYKQINE